MAWTWGVFWDGAWDGAKGTFRDYFVQMKTLITNAQILIINVFLFFVFLLLYVFFITFQFIFKSFESLKTHQIFVTTSFVHFFCSLPVTSVPASTRSVKRRYPDGEWWVRDRYEHMLLVLLIKVVLILLFWTPLTFFIQTKTVLQNIFCVPQVKEFINHSRIFILGGTFPLRVFQNWSGTGKTSSII